MRKPDSTVGIVGGLSAFPRRLAAKAVAGKGGRLRRGITRHTARVVLGRTLLDKQTDAEIEQRIAALRETGTKLVSENGFLLLAGAAGGAGAIQSFAAVAARAVEARWAGVRSAGAVRRVRA